MSEIADVNIQSSIGMFCML